jgi:hypothetical protein
VVNRDAAGNSSAHSRAICAGDNSRACSTNNRAFDRSIRPARSSAATPGSRTRSCSARSCSANAAPVVTANAGPISWTASGNGAAARATAPGVSGDSHRPTSAITANSRAC